MGVGNGVVNDQGHAVRVGDTGKQLQIRDDKRRIRQRFGKHAARVILERSVQLLLRAVGIHEGAVDAHFLERLVEQVEGAAVNGARAHHVVTRMADVDDCHHRSGLAGGRQHGADAAFQRGNLLLHGIQRGVAQAGVEKAVVVQIKEAAHRLRRFVAECRALHNRQNTRLPVAGVVSRVYAFRIDPIIAHLLYTPFVFQLRGKNPLVPLVKPHLPEAERHGATFLSYHVPRAEARAVHDLQNTG